MTKIPYLDNLLIRIILEVVPREKLALVDATEELQLEKGHVSLKKEIFPSLRAGIISVLLAY